MRSVFPPKKVILVLLCLLVWCSGETENAAAPMEEGEQASLCSAIQGFVGNWWNGSDLYPDPCGWTPIQVLLHYVFIKSLLTLQFAILSEAQKTTSSSSVTVLSLHLSRIF